MNAIAPLGVLLQGALLGTGIGLAAVGLVLVYRTTRIVNFAHGAIGGAAAELGVAMFTGHHWPWPTAILLALVTGGLVGWVIERGVIGRMRNAHRMAVTVVTIGLAQLFGGTEALLPGWVGGQPIVPGLTTAVSDVHLNVGPVVISGDDLVLAGAALLLVGVLTWFLQRTELGTAMRGIADNSERARLLGVPVARVSGATWAIAAALGAVATVLAAPSQGLPLTIVAGPSLLLPALAAAIVAGLDRVHLAFGAGVLLGVLDQVVRWHVSKQSVTDIVLLGVILVALAVRRRREAGDGSAVGVDGVWTPPRHQLPPAVRDRLAARLPAAAAYLRRPEGRRRVSGAGVLAAVVVLVLMPYVLSESDLDLASSAIVFAIVGMSLLVLVGWSGVLSLGQFAVAGVGAVVVANMVARWHQDLLLSLVLGAVAGGLVALVLGLPSLRLPGLYLAVTTLAFAVAMDSYVLNPTNFPGLLPTSVDRPVLWKRFDLLSEGALYELCLGCLAVVVVLVWNLRRGRTGRVIVAARDNAAAAAAAAVSPRRAALTAFVVAGMIAGLAGGLAVVLTGGIGFHSFDPSRSMLVLSVVVVGGAESFTGVLAGAAVGELITYLLPQNEGLVVVGLALIAASAAQGLAATGRSALAHRRAGGGAPAMPADMLVRCTGLRASYGPQQVLFDVDLDVRPGELLALLGTNGAGKSTILRTLTGLLASEGEVSVAGLPRERLTPERLARRGVALMPGGRGLFPSLTVADNLRLSRWMLTDEFARQDAHRQALATFPFLAERLDVRAGTLSGGEQQMLSMAMALATAPTLLCIDELSLGLAPSVVADLVARVRDLHARGTTVIVVEQSVNVALTVADRAVFLEKGAVRYTGPTRDLLERPDVLAAAFLGDAAASLPARPPRPVPAGVAALECRDLAKRYGGVAAVDGVSLRVAAGEVVGLIGHNGAGKTSLLDLISGFRRPDGGSVAVGGTDVTGFPAHRRAVAGLGRSFQDARLYPSLTVAEALTVAYDRHLTNRDPVAAALRLPPLLESEAIAAERVAHLIGLLGLGRYRDHRIVELSTGTRRIVEMGCALAHDPAVLLLDEPSSGVAQRDVEALGPLLRRVRDTTGCAMVLIEHDMTLVGELCDRLVALELGAVIADGSPREVLTHPRVVASYLGTDPHAVARSGAPAPTPVDH